MVLTRWPNRLSKATEQGRRSFHLTYGDKSLREAVVVGLGKDYQFDDSVSRKMNRLL